MKKRSVIIIIILGTILCLALAPLASVITPIVLIIFGSLIVYKLDRVLEELKNKNQGGAITHPLSMIFPTYSVPELKRKARFRNERDVSITSTKAGNCHVFCFVLRKPRFHQTKKQPAVERRKAFLLVKETAGPTNGFREPPWMKWSGNAHSSVCAA